jgi:hypothetical protein
MKRLIGIALVLGLALGGLRANAGGGSTKEIFELKVGNKVYKVEIDKPFTIRTPKGENIKAVLTRQETQMFSGHGIQFQHHHEMKVTTETQMGVTTITAESTSSPLCIIQVYSVPITAPEVEKLLVTSLENEFKSRKAEFMQGSGTSIKEKVGGVMRPGRKLDFLLAGQRFNAKVFAFKKNKSVVALMMQNDLQDKVVAQKYFTIILNSLK